MPEMGRKGENPKCDFKLNDNECKHRKGIAGIPIVALPTGEGRKRGKKLPGTDGMNKLRSAEEIGAWLSNLHLDMGCSHIAESGARIHVCSAHFLPSEWNESGPLFGAKARGAQSVEMALPPTTPSPSTRVRSRAMATFDTDTDSASPKKIIKSLLPELTADLVKAELRSQSFEKDVEYYKALTQKQAETLKQQAITIEDLREQLAKRTDDSILIKFLKVEYGLGRTTYLRHLAYENEICHLTLTIEHVSFARLVYDPRFNSNVKGMTGFGTVRQVYLYFLACLALNKGYFPQRYTSVHKPDLIRVNKTTQVDTPLHVYDDRNRLLCSAVKIGIGDTSRETSIRIDLATVTSQGDTSLDKKDGPISWKNTRLRRKIPLVVSTRNAVEVAIGNRGEGAGQHADDSKNYGGQGQNKDNDDVKDNNPDTDNNDKKDTKAGWNPAYRPYRGSPAEGKHDDSWLQDWKSRHETFKEHLDRFFFTLYVIRTGPSSMELAAAHFGYDASNASRWHTSYVRFQKISLTRKFPQPTKELIIKSTPNKFHALFGRNRLVGVLDCTECRMQIASNKMAQRATWSAYKHFNSVKFLVIISPCGACIYVSPGFPGRISDNQICDKCINYNEDD